MKLTALGLASLLLLTGCSSIDSTTGSTTENTAVDIETACANVRQGFLWLEAQQQPEAKKVSEALFYFEEAVLIFRELLSDNPKYLEYIEMLGAFKTSYWMDADYKSRPLQAFCAFG